MSGGNAGDGPRVTLREAHSEDKDGIMRLRERSPDAGARQDPAVWDWLFERNTSSSRLYGYVAESDGSIVSQHATLPVRLTHSGKDLAGLLSKSHVATDPASAGTDVHLAR